MWNQGQPYPFYAVSARWSIISKVRKRVGYRGPLPNHWQSSVRSEWYDTSLLSIFLLWEWGGGVSFFELFTPPHIVRTHRGEAKNSHVAVSPPEAPDRQKNRYDPPGWALADFSAMADFFIAISRITYSTVAISYESLIKTWHAAVGNNLLQA